MIELDLIQSLIIRAELAFNGLNNSPSLLPSEVFGLLFSCIDFEATPCLLGPVCSGDLGVGLNM